MHEVFRKGHLMSARASQKDRRLNIDHIITAQVVTDCRPASLAPNRCSDRQYRSRRATDPAMTSSYPNNGPAAEDRQPPYCDVASTKWTVRQRQSGRGSWSRSATRSEVRAVRDRVTAAALDRVAFGGRAGWVRAQSASRRMTMALPSSPTEKTLPGEGLRRTSHHRWSRSAWLR
jgi:hypothetical protein